MKVEIVHPVDHDGKVYDRGVQDLPDHLAKTFLNYPWAARALPDEGAATLAPVPLSGPAAFPTEAEKKGKKK